MMATWLLMCQFNLKKCFLVFGATNRVAADTEGDISMDEPLMLKKMQQSVDEDDQGEEV